MFPGHATLGSTLPAGGALQSFALETILTFMLMFVILSVSTGPKEKGIIAGCAVCRAEGMRPRFSPHMQERPGKVAQYASAVEAD
jgi:aquaporin Z